MGYPCYLLSLLTSKAKPSVVPKFIANIHLLRKEYFLLCCTYGLGDFIVCICSLERHQSCTYDMISFVFYA